MQDENYVPVSNRWFYLVDGENFSLLYGSRGFTLQARMLQRLSMRQEYDLTDRHIQQWFGYKNYREVRNIFHILGQFQQDGLIVCDEDYDFTKACSDVVVFKPTEILLSPARFFKIYDYEIDAVLMSDINGVDKTKLFLLFGCLKYYYNTDAKIAYPTIETLMQETRLSQTTILSYIDILVGLGLILYGNPGTKLYPDGNVKECNNVYTMNYKGNKEVLDREISRVVGVLQQQEEQSKIKLTNNAIGNQRRSIRTTQRHLTDRFNQGKITSAEYEQEYNHLEDKYAKLLDKKIIL